MALPASGALLMKMIEEGEAIFSTRLGKYPPRRATPPFAPIILRSDPVGDQQEMIAELLHNYPQQCKDITAPIMNIYQYFDHYDVMLKGVGFLHAVLVDMALENSMRATKVQEFAELWQSGHFEQFHSITPETQEIFTEEEKGRYDEDFLKDAFAQLQCLRMAMPLRQSQYLENIKGSSVLDMSSTVANDRVNPLRTISQPLQSSNYSALVQAKRYVSAPQPPTYAGSARPVRPLLQRFHSGQGNISTQQPTSPANVGYFSTPHSPVTGAVHYLGHDPWNREPPKHTFHPKALIRPSHPEVPITMQLRLPFHQTEFSGSRREHPDSPLQEQLRPIREDSGYDVVELARPWNDSSPYSNHQNRPIDSGKPAKGTPRFSTPRNLPPQSGSTNLTIFTENPKDDGNNVARRYPGAVGPFPYRVLQPSQFVRPGNPPNQQNFTIEHHNMVSVPQTRGRYGQPGRGGSAASKRGRINFSNEARVLEQQDAHSRYEPSYRSNSYEEQPLHLPLQRPRQDSGPQRSNRSSLTHHVGRAGYPRGGVTDAGYSGRGMGSGDYAGYMFPDDRERRHHFNPVDFSGGMKRRRDLQTSSDEVSPGEGDHSQAQGTHLAHSHGLSSHADGKFQTLSNPGNPAWASPDMPMIPVHVAAPNAAKLWSDGEDSQLPQSINLAASQMTSSFSSNPFQRRSQPITDHSRSLHGPEKLEITRVWVGGLQIDVGMDALRELFSTCGTIVDISMGRPRDGAPRLWAFITFDKADAAANAMESFDGKQFSNRRIDVQPAHSQTLLGPYGKNHQFTQSPARSFPRHDPERSIASVQPVDLQPMDGSMDTVQDPPLMTTFEGTAHGIPPEDGYRDWVLHQQHVATPLKTPKKRAHDSSAGMQKTNWSGSSKTKTQEAQGNASTDARITGHQFTRPTGSGRNSIVRSSKNNGELPSSQEAPIFQGAPKRRDYVASSITEDSPGSVILAEDGQLRNTNDPIDRNKDINREASIPQRSFPTRRDSSSPPKSQVASIEKKSQGPRATKDRVVDTSPSRKMKTTNVIDVSSKVPPTQFPESGDNKALWTMVEISQQEPPAATPKNSATGTRHGSFNQPDSTVYPGSDSTSEALIYGTSLEKGLGGLPRKKKASNAPNGKRKAVGAIHRKPNTKISSTDPSDDQSSTAQITKKSVARGKGVGKRQQDSHAFQGHHRIQGNTSTGTVITAGVLSLAQFEIMHSGHELDRGLGATMEIANQTSAVIQHQINHGNNGKLTDSTADTTNIPQIEPLQPVVSGKTAPTRNGKQTAPRRHLSEAEVSAAEIECSCPSPPASSSTQPVALSRKAQVVSESQEINTSKSRSGTSFSVPNTPKSKRKTVGGSQTKSTKKSSTAMSSTQTLGLGMTMGGSATIASPPKTDDESAFPPLGSSDEDKHKQSVKLTADVKSYYAARHADYNVKLRAGIRALVEGTSDVAGGSDSGGITAPPMNITFGRLDRKENVPKDGNDTVSGGTSASAEAASNTATRGSNQGGNAKANSVTAIGIPVTNNGRPLIYSQVASSPSNVTVAKPAPQPRKDGDLATLDTNVHATEMLGKDQVGNGSDVWALPKGERRWSTASTL